MLHLALNDIQTLLAQKATAAFVYASGAAGYSLGYWFRDRHA
ncbi:hypothetical protein C8D96_1367 [Kushneria marisflavi]|nr:hypothetical protein C8D96_1367 [Kushneria marisflavi]